MFLHSNSKQINKTFQIIQATKELLVSSLIYGESNTGKKTFIREIFKNSTWVDGSNIEDVKFSLKNSDNLVITNFEKILNYKELEFENINIVAILNSKTYDKNLDNKFAFIYYMPPLRDRKEDVKLFTNYYLKSAKKLFNIKENIELESRDIDISNNIKSLKSSIFKTVLYKTVSKDELFDILYYYFLKNYEGKNVYKEQLELFEKALITAGLDIYKSQLKLSDILGINRNTLRKKINEIF